jgi:glycosyltransferase involved in cell wall biosynthesis
MTELPGVSVLIATLNAERYLETCMRSLKDQDYPPHLVEVIVADAGSTDSTLELLARYEVDRVVPNPGVTTEAARAILNALATTSLILYVDADNYLVGRDWLRRMVQPFLDDPDIFAAEPIRFDYEPSDPPLNRYFALAGVNDPLSLFMGNYGRYSYVTGKWTEMSHREDHRNGYIVAELQPDHVPTMGSQGFLVRTEVLRQVSLGDYYFDLDGPVDLVNKGHCRVAKVDVSIGHQFAPDLASLHRKTLRRIEDYLYWRDRRSFPWLSSGRLPVVKFSLATLLVLPLVWQLSRGWLRVRDPAWLYHIPVCWLTLWIYGWAILRSAGRRAPHSRKGWQL